jgi:hypothetical protein
MDLGTGAKFGNSLFVAPTALNKENKLSDAPLG